MEVPLSGPVLVTEAGEEMAGMTRATSAWAWK